VTGDEAKTGKRCTRMPPGKATFVSLLGLDGARPGRRRWWPRPRRRLPPMARARELDRRARFVIARDKLNARGPDDRPTQDPAAGPGDLPADLKALSRPQLRQLADELRAETISAVSVTGGHLGAGLGVVELTVALHAVFDTPRDKLIWDVGHQCYPHKILTGRRDRIRTLRMKAGCRASPSGRIAL
jgi:hypothetical protein